MNIIENIKNLKQNRFYKNYRRMWPYVKPVWFRALCSMLICIPIGSLDAVIALALYGPGNGRKIHCLTLVYSAWNCGVYFHSRRIKVHVLISFYMGWRKNYKRS